MKSPLPSFQLDLQGISCVYVCVNVDHFHTSPYTFTTYINFPKIPKSL